jgi:glutaredoxin
LETQVLGLSVDSTATLRAWAESLGGISYPLLSDFYPHGAVARLYGVLRSEGYAERALFLIDKAGVIRYVDVHDINEQPAKVEPDLARALEPKRAAERANVPPRPDADVILYCTPWCPSCRIARPWLAERHVAHLEVDISKDRAAAARVRSVAGGNETTPTFDIRGTVIVGLHLDAVEEALRQAGLLGA